MAQAKRRPEQIDPTDTGTGEGDTFWKTADLGCEPKTELGRFALAARREFLAANGRFLTREELEREIAERRGGIHLLDLDRP